MDESLTTYLPTMESKHDDLEETQDNLHSFYAIVPESTDMLIWKKHRTISTTSTK